MSDEARKALDLTPPRARQPIRSRIAAGIGRRHGRRATFRLATLLIAALAPLTSGQAANLLALPADARLQAERSEPLASIRLPIAPLRNGKIDQTELEGAVTQQAWQIAATGLSTLQMLAPLREQLDAAGFASLLECEARDCGGFDFRYAQDLLPEPDMHVDLGDYRYLLARRGSESAAEHVALMISRTADRGFLHITQVAGRSDGARETVSPSSPSAESAPRARPQSSATAGSTPRKTETAPVIRRLPNGSLLRDLEQTGRAVLSDLSFETGSARLSEERFDSLRDLAEWLVSHPEKKIVLVGHTDAEGALDSNIALSRARATAVRDRLNKAHGVPLRRMSAEGVGYLVPVASNATERGRTQNRRVEVVLEDAR